ncbi:MAG TPA: metal-dependent hydrolase [Acidimicrobiales bacterium]|nr:metal-dependent hydrolase [Acidimicrobiales bacterium]
MSWATHELENYVIQKHAKTRVSFLAVALGAFAPDLLTKGFVYGVNIGPLHLVSASPVDLHRGWPGLGFTHSLLFGAVAAALVLRFTGSRAWALGLLIGTAGHVLTDVNDTAGTMLFFPFSTVTVTTGMWKHAAYLGRYGDAAAYYSSPGGLWDTLWLGIVLVAARRTLRADYFRTVVVPSDPHVWAWIHRRFRLPERGLVALYRGLLFYGACRIAAWTIYARFVAKAPWDPSWGGPAYVERIDVSPGSWWSEFRSAAIGAVLLAAFVALVWRLVVRRWWQQGYSVPLAAPAAAPT